MANPDISDSTEANEQFRTALDLKSKGQTDTALTWFRRAVISDPQFIGAYIEIGRLCKDKARLDPMFLRYAFEAYRKAARLDFSLQEAHDEYILLAQRMGVLDTLHDEYESWSKQNPENELLQRCYKDIVAISMAIFSPRIEVGQAKASPAMKNMVLLGAIFTILLGAALIFVPSFLVRAGKMKKESVPHFVVAGLIVAAIGAGGVIFYRQME